MSHLRRIHNFLSSCSTFSSSSSWWFYSSRFAVFVIHYNLYSFTSLDLFYATSLLISLTTSNVTPSKDVMFTNSTYVSLFFIHFMFVSCVFLIISPKIYAFGLIPVAPSHFNL